jgi:hypothetical protein
MPEGQPESPKSELPESECPESQPAQATDKSASSSPSPSQILSDNVTTEAQKTEDLLSDLLKVLSAGWNQLKPVLRTQSIQLLRGTIQLLDKLATTLEAESDVSSTQAPATSAAERLTSPAQQSGVESLRKLLTDILARVKPLLAQLYARWVPILSKLRSRLPEPWNTKFSDQALTGIIAAGLILILWFLTSLQSGKPSQLAAVPAPQRTPLAAWTPPSAVLTPSQERPVVIPVTPAPAGVASAPTVGDIGSSAEPQPSTLQDRVAAVSDRYVEDLILSVQPNVQESRLVIKVSSAWYDLNPSRQDDLAEDVLQRSQDLAFSKLEIKDSQNDIVARSPVVGNKMVVLKRRKSAVG